MPLRMPKTRVGQIKNHRLLRQSNLVMNLAGGRWLQKIPTHRTVDQTTDSRHRKRCSLQRIFATDDAQFAGWRSGCPKTTLANTSHQFQPTGRKPQTLVKWRKLLLDIVAGPDFLGNRVSKRFQADVVVFHDVGQKIGVRSSITKNAGFCGRLHPFPTVERLTAHA